MIRAVACLVLGGALVAPPVRGQIRWERSDRGWCEASWGDRDRDHFCDVLVATWSSTGRLQVDGGANGGVSVEGWDRDVVEVRAKVWAHAGSAERAEEIARAVSIQSRGGRVAAEGPEARRHEGWSVSFEVRVPRSTDLELDTHNGGITVAAVSGDIRFTAVNGGIHLAGVGGDVHGETANGGLHVELSGDRWTGDGLDVTTRNGGIRLVVPEDYSAELTTGTVNGGIDVDFPVRVSGRIGRRLHTTLGEGGPPIRVMTTNGGVRVSQR